MRSSSSSKKYPEFDKYFESRALASHNLTSPSQPSISTKLDLIKQEISRQFHEKFNNQKRRNTSAKKANIVGRSKSKSNRVDLVEAKINLFREPQLTHSVSHKKYAAVDNLENQSFRQKFYQLQDKFIAERDKSIQFYQKYRAIKQQFIEFLQQPGESTCSILKQKHFSLQKQHKVLGNFMMMTQDLQYADNILTEILSIIKVESVEQLLEELRRRQEGFKDLNQCTYKILQLQAALNKMEVQCEERVRNCMAEMKEEQQQMRLEMEKRVEMSKIEQKEACSRKLAELLERLTKSQAALSQDQNGNTSFESNSRFMFATFDKNSKGARDTVNERTRQVVRFQEQEAPVPEFQQMIDSIEELVEQIEANMYEIENEAMQNYDKLHVSKDDMQRLENKIQSLALESIEEKNKLVEHFEKLLLQKEDFVGEMQRQFQVELAKRQIQKCELRQRIAKLEEDVLAFHLNSERLKTSMKQVEDHAASSQQILKKIIKIICEATGENTQLFDIEIRNGELVTKNDTEIGVDILGKVEGVLNNHLILLKENLQAAENLILWHQKQLDIKEGLLKQFDFNLKKLMEQSEASRESEKRAIFEKDEYKYLLTNLRENVRQIKKQYEQKLVKVAQDKDEEYLHSNKQILIQNKKLNNQIQKLTEDLQNIQQKLSHQTSSNTFNKKKSQQLESSLLETRKKLVQAEAEAAKYKSMLNQIESSFREVEALADSNGGKISELLGENEHLGQQLQQAKAQIKSQLQQIQSKDDKLNKLQYSWEDIKKQLDKTEKVKEDLEQENSNLRLRNLDLVEQFRGRIEQANKIQYENGILEKQNKKLMEEVNNLTKRLIDYVGNIKTTPDIKQGRSNRQLRVLIAGRLNELRTENSRLKQVITRSLHQSATFISQKHSQIAKHTKKFALLQENCQKVKAELKQSYEAKLTLSLNLLALTEEVNQLKRHNNQLEQSHWQQIQALKAERDHSMINMQDKKEKLFFLQQALSTQQEALKVLRQQNQQVKLELKKGQNQISLNIQQILDHYAAYALNNSPAKVGGQVEFTTAEKNQYQQMSMQQRPGYLNEGEYEGMPSPQFVKIRKSNNTEQNQSVDDNNKPVDFQLQLKQANLNEVSNKAELSFRSKVHDKSIYAAEKLRVARILKNLRDNEHEQPEIPYFDSIKAEFAQLKKKITKKALQLDISVSSPSSVSFYRDNNTFEKKQRFDTDPGEEIILGVNKKQSNRSEYHRDTSTMHMRKQLQFLRQHNQELIRQLREKEEQFDNEVEKLKAQYNILYNESEKKSKEKHFLMFLDELIKEKWKDALTSCTILIKHMSISDQDKNKKIKAFAQYAEEKDKKGGLANWFSSGKKA